MYRNVKKQCEWTEKNMPRHKALALDEFKQIYDHASESGSAADLLHNIAWIAFKFGYAVGVNAERKGFKRKN